MYRIVTLAVLRAGVDPPTRRRGGAIAAAAELRSGTDPAAPHIALDGEDVTAEIRGAGGDRAVSAVSANPAVRRLLVRPAARAGRQASRPGIGGRGPRHRHASSLPDAALKVYLTAAAEVRAARRAAQDRKAGRVGRRRRRARRRPPARPARLHPRHAPLHAAADAVVLDTDGLSVDAVLTRLMELAQERGLLT